LKIKAQKLKEPETIDLEKLVKITQDAQIEPSVAQGLNGVYSTQKLRIIKPGRSSS